MLAASPLYATLFASPVVPSHDGPKTLYASHVLAHLREPAFAGDFTSGGAITSAGFSWLFGLLEVALGWRIGYALAVAIVVTSIPVGVLLIARALDSRRAPVALVAVAAMYPWAAHMGFVNYVASLGLGLITVGIGLAHARWSLRRELAVYALLSLTTFFHPLGAQLAMLAIGMFRLLGTDRARVVREMGAMFLACVPMVAVTLIVRDELVEEAVFHPKSEIWQLTGAERLETLGRWFLSGPLYRSGFVGAVAAIGIAGATGVLVGRRLDRRVVALFAIIVPSALATATFPMHGLDWQFFQPRFIAPMMLVGLALVPFERLSPRLQPLFVSVFFAHAVASNAWVAVHHARFFRQHRAAFASLVRPPVAQGRTMLPIVGLPETDQRVQRANHEVPSSSYLHNLGQLYGVARDAVVPYTFSAVRRLHVIHDASARMPHVPARDYALAFETDADPTRHAYELGRLASYGLLFDDVLFYGREVDAAALIAFGFETEARDDGFFVGHFVGCERSITLDGAAADEGATIAIAFGTSARVAASAVADGGRVRIPRLPCGLLGVRPFATLRGAPLRCEGADEHGFLRVPPAAAIRCTLELAPPTLR